MEYANLKNALERPFPPNRLHWRVGATAKDKTSGIALAYLDARDVKKRLDDVLGFDWQNRYTLSDNGLLICEIGVRVNDEWIWRANGAGDTKVEAEKGRASDAFKRAGTMWGIGTYLYSLRDKWMPLKPKGNSYELVGTPPLPEWATPEGYDKLISERKAA